MNAEVRDIVNQGERKSGVQRGALALTSRFRKQKGKLIDNVREDKVPGGCSPCLPGHRRGKLEYYENQPSSP